MSRRLFREVLGPARLTLLRDPDERGLGLEPHLLAGAVPDGSYQVGAELGAGEGTASLLLARRFPGLTMTGFELRLTVVQRARWSAAASGLDGRVSFLPADVRDHAGLGAPRRCDLVLMNPPFFEAGTGRPGRSAAEQESQTEIHGTFRDFVRAAGYLLRDGGLLMVILWPHRGATSLAILEREGLQPIWLRAVHQTPADPAHNLIIQAIRFGGGPLRVGPPLILDPKLQTTRSG